MSKGDVLILRTLDDKRWIWNRVLSTVDLVDKGKPVRITTQNRDSIALNVIENANPILVYTKVLRAELKRMKGAEFYVQGISHQAIDI